jgi:hypothetical protein
MVGSEFLVTYFKKQLEIRGVALFEEGFFVFMRVGTFLYKRYNYPSRGVKYLSVVFFVILSHKFSTFELILVSVDLPIFKED